MAKFRSVHHGVMAASIVAIALSAVYIIIGGKASAAVTTFLPSATLIGQWTPSPITPVLSHHTLVDDGAICDGVVTRLESTVIGKTEAYVVNIASIPSSSVITGIQIRLCAGTIFTSPTGTNPVVEVFYVAGTATSTSRYLNYSKTSMTTAPTASWTGLSIPKSGLANIQVWIKHHSGTKGIRLSNVRTTLTY